MPHILLECSDNVVEKDELVSILKKADELLEKALPAQLPRFKSRAIVHENYVVGDGSPDHAFVHVTMKLIPGRKLDDLDKAGNLLLEFLKDAFKETTLKNKLCISLEIQDFSPTYLYWNAELKFVQPQMASKA
jgi:5-carboxymethyl-2-hydroxymuconate isomerase